eukprot:758319-Hanusia_phi.AAC.4
MPGLGVSGSIREYPGVSGRQSIRDLSMAEAPSLAGLVELLCCSGANDHARRSLSQDPINDNSSCISPSLSRGHLRYLLCFCLSGLLSHATCLLPSRVLCLRPCLATLLHPILSSPQLSSLKNAWNLLPGPRFIFDDWVENGQQKVQETIRITVFVLTSSHVVCISHVAELVLTSVMQFPFPRLSNSLLRKCYNLHNAHLPHITFYSVSPCKQPGHASDKRAGGVGINFKPDVSGALYVHSLVPGSFLSLEEEELKIHAGSPAALDGLITEGDRLEQVDPQRQSGDAALIVYLGRRAIRVPLLAEARSNPFSCSTSC